MSSIFQQNEYYKELKLVIDEELIKKIATTYEESMIFSQDDDVIKTITTNQEIIKDLRDSVNNTKGKSEIDGYNNTKDALGALSNKIGDLSSTLDVLNENIKNKSRENHEKLLEAANNLKTTYDRYCRIIDTDIQSYKTLSENYYNPLNNKISNTDKNDPAYSSLNKQLNTIKDRMNDLTELIATYLNKLTTEIKPPLEQLLEDGLKKSSI